MPIVNKVTFNGDTIMDISDTTAVAADVAEGKYFYASDGTKTAGTSSGGGGGGGETPEITVTSSGSVSQELQPDTVYHFTSESLTALTITFSGTGQYHFDFISPATAVTLTLPSSVIMSTNFSVEVNSKYEIDIVDNYGVYAVWVYEVT